MRPDLLQGRDATFLLRWLIKAMVVPHLAELVDYVTHLFPKLTPAERRISIALYRLLAEGRPVKRAALAVKAELPLEKVSEVLGNWYGVFYDAAGDVIGYWGLALGKMNHRMRINGRTLYAWCAWDTLFLPRLIGAVAQVESTCPVSGGTIRLKVSPRGVETVEPTSTLVSFVMPDRAKVEQNIVLSFCHHVHFFKSADVAQRWLVGRSATQLLTVNEAWMLGLEKNTTQYDDDLELASVE